MASNVTLPEPLDVSTLMALGYIAFGIYTTWAAFQNGNYWFDPYLSPFYSPLLGVGGDTGAPILINVFGGHILGLTLSPAFLILWAPLCFRGTCYYHRNTYYRAFFLRPVSCAVRDKCAKYTGESRFPFKLQNLHRFFWYIDACFIFLLLWDLVMAFRFPVEGQPGVVHFGIGVGTLVMAVNVFLLASYTFSCHSCRHVLGGHVDNFDHKPVRRALWLGISKINVNHHLFAWVSLTFVALTDIYVRLCATGVIHDLRWVSPIRLP